MPSGKNTRYGSRNLLRLLPAEESADRVRGFPDVVRILRRFLQALAGVLDDAAHVWRERRVLRRALNPERDADGLRIERRGHGEIQHAGRRDGAIPGESTEGR